MKSLCMLVIRQLNFNYFVACTVIVVVMVGSCQAFIFFSKGVIMEIDSKYFTKKQIDVIKFMKKGIWYSAYDGELPRPNS